MTSTEKFCLKWNDFQQNISTAYTEIRKNGDFSDVTLMSGDDQKIEAHRVILSSCSPFFMKILKKTKHPHPMIYMRGIKGKDLMALVDFIYHGETNIYQDDLDGFMSIAEELQLKGLTGSSQEDETCFSEGVMNESQYNPAKMVTEQKIRRESPPDFTTTEEDVVKRHFDNSGTVAIPDMNTSKVIPGNTDELDRHISTMIQKLDGSSMWSCTACGKTSKQMYNIRQHIEAIHIEGMEHPCDQCGKVSRSRHALA